MRDPAREIFYLVGTPKGRLSRLEKQLLAKPWQEARPGVSVKLLAEDDELYVYAASVDRVQTPRIFCAAVLRIVARGSPCSAAR